LFSACFARTQASFPALSLAKMLSGVNAFEISDVQEEKLTLEHTATIWM
jgi:hypothetical protein